MSLRTSEVLVRRIERLAEGLQTSDALLGALAALAADSPEVTSAVAAISHHQADVGAGVVLGSAVFNLTALLGLGAVIARGIPLGRRVVVLGGTVTACLTLLALLTVGSHVAPVAPTAIGIVVLSGYLALLGWGPGGLSRLGLPARLHGWLAAAVAEEELAEEEEFREDRARYVPVAGGRLRDGTVALVALVVVVGTSYAMERAVTDLGSRIGAPGIVVGALVLGGVTGIPNAVASIYLVRKGNPTAALSTALNSNNFNIVLGLLIPAVVVGAGARSTGVLVVASWCLGLTLVLLVLAHRKCGVPRGYGLATLGLYVTFVAAVIATGFS